MEFRHVVQAVLLSISFAIILLFILLYLHAPRLAEMDLPRYVDVYYTTSDHRELYFVEVNGQLIKYANCIKSSSRKEITSPPYMLCIFSPSMVLGDSMSLNYFGRLDLSSGKLYKCVFDETKSTFECRYLNTVPRDILNEIREMFEI